MTTGPAAREDARDRAFGARIAMAVTAIIFLMAAAVAYFIRIRRRLPHPGEVT
jgi:hypothetical protein